jgi:hypothetical protein
MTPVPPCAAGDRISRASNFGSPAEGLAAPSEIELAGRRYITAERLAGVLGVTVRTLARWNARRIGPPKIKVGKVVLFDLSKLPEWLAAREVAPTPSKSFIATGRVRDSRA